MARMSLKARRQMMQVAKLGALLLLVVLFVTPIRDLVLSPVLPGCWLGHNTWRVLHMLTDNQRFPITAPFDHPPPPANARIPTFNVTDLSRFLYREDDDPFAEFFRQRAALQKRSLTDPAALQELALMEPFQPVMSATERAQLMFTVHVLHSVCKANDITFFIFEGSLLGAHRHQGLVPWDDDIDVAFNASEWRKIRAVLGNVPGFTLHAPPDSQWKFYMSHLPRHGDKVFKFPYIDLFFFAERGDYVWGVTWGMKNHLMLPAKHLFPLTTVAWERLTLPAPRCVRRMVLDNYGHGCMTPKYVHKTDERRYGFQTDNVDCSRLYKYLPFAFRQTVTVNVKGAGVGGSGGGVREVVLETRRVGSRVLGNFTLPVTPRECSEDW